MAQGSNPPPGPVNVCVAGVTGEVGRLLTTGLLQRRDMVLTSAVARSAAGRTVGEVLGCDCDVEIRPSLAEALSREKVDVLVDYTSASAAFDNVQFALSRGVHVVVGSSGITTEQFEQLDGLAKRHRVGAIYGNFSITATLLQVFAAGAARYLKSWEIIEYAHDGKIDAVSGTAHELAGRLRPSGPSKHELEVGAFVGDARSRGASVEGTQVHAVRLPGMAFGIEIVFGRDHERLTIKHEALSRAEPYIDGTLLAIREVPKLIGVHRGLESILDLNLH